MIQTSIAILLLSASALAQAHEPPARVLELQDHWSFQRLKRPSIPLAGDGWARNPIDRFVAARFELEGLEPTPPATRRAWLRRVTFDLNGLPPSLEELRTFEADRSPRSYEKVVDRLLQSSAYGERWASLWLDLARYADSRGYEKDLGRTIWPWRDWVVDALQRDVPFDRFSIEQLAGDLIADADERTRLATAFHRNTMSNDEGGTDDEEFRSLAVKDRVETSYQVWMGLTMGCARCHDHKYDPLTSRDYYASYAVFDQTADADRSDEFPTLPVPSPEQREQIRSAKAELAAARFRLDEETQQEHPAGRAWVADRMRSLAAEVPQATTWSPWAYSGVVANPAWGDGAKIESWTVREDWIDGKSHTVHSRPQATFYLRRRFEVPSARMLRLSFGSDYGLRILVDGEERLVRDVQRGVAPDQDRLETAVLPGTHELILQVRNGGGPSGFHFGRASEHFDGVPFDLADAIARCDPRDAMAHAAQRTRLLEIWISEHSSEARELRAEIEGLQQRIAGLERAAPRVPVLRELDQASRRVTREHRRGNFLDPGDTIAAGLPSAFDAGASESGFDREAFARWLFAAKNPLTARVHANRLWAQLFGQGLVATQEDFGTQGSAPSHPELLDWLADELRRMDWSQKSLLRTIALSATYRQSSRASKSLLDRDRFNTLLARGPRVRLSAEMVRDQSLAASGLLSAKLGGPPVFPPQPPGIWQVVYDKRDWTPSHGPDRYRRALYTYWRRTSPYPAYLIFDAPSRDVCSARRIRTITPLQALLTWNDPAHVEAAQALARRVRRLSPKPEESLSLAFEISTSRPPNEVEIRALLRLYEERRGAWGKDLEAARAFACDPVGPAPRDVDLEELAALTACCSTILNLDAALTKG